jgi:DNA polymerase-3 subunit gamma/tau
LPLFDSPIVAKIPAKETLPPVKSVESLKTREIAPQVLNQPTGLPSFKEPKNRYKHTDNLSTPSISGMLNGGRLSAVPESDKDGLKTRPDPKEQYFDASQLIEAWKTFADSVEAAQLRSALSVRDPNITEDYNIVYNLDNELQRQRITLDLKPKLLAYLHTALHNEKITVEFNVKENLEEIRNRPYTNQEKFNVLAAKYPLLGSMKQKFGLDFD